MNYLEVEQILASHEEIRRNKFFASLLAVTEMANDVVPFEMAQIEKFENVPIELAQMPKRREIRNSTAAVAAGKLKAPSYTQFRNSYPHAKMSSTSFYRLRDPNNKAYKNNRAFENLVEEFEEI